jgi:hypothetical protein
MQAHARADAPVSAPSGCSKAPTTSVAESPQCAEATAGDERPPDLHSDSHGPRWYGWQTLLVDGLSLGLTMAGGAIDSSELAILGISGMLLAAPIVHFGHHNVLGTLSLGLRVACAVMIVVGLASIDDEDDDTNGPVWLATAGLVGLGITSVLDAAALAFERSSTTIAPYADARGSFGVKMRWRL